MLERPLTPLEREGEGEMPDTVSKIEGLMLLIYCINVINLCY